MLVAPNTVWFDNVERVAALRGGQEPVRYVRNIYKYYIAYKLIQEDEAADKAARSVINASVAPPRPTSTSRPNGSAKPCAPYLENQDFPQSPLCNVDLLAPPTAR